MKPGMRMAMARYRAEMESAPSGNPRGNPMGQMNDGMDDYWNEPPQNRRRRDRRGRFMEMENDIHSYYGRNEMDDEPQMAYPKPRLLPKKEQKKDHQMGFHGNSEKAFTEKTAKEWVEAMDGKWSMEDVKPYMAQVSFKGNPAEFFAVMNALYSDYCEVAKRFGIDRPEFYAMMAKAFIDDEDAVEGKVAKYYECIVEH